MTLVNRLSCTEVAEMKGCSRQAVNKAIRTGKLDAERIGNQNAVLANKRLEDWSPNPKIQKAGKARAKKAKKAKRNN